MKAIISLVFSVAVCFLANGYQVSVGTYVSNAGKTVTVPIELDNAAGLSYAGATITYDPREGDAE